MTADFTLKVIKYGVVDTKKYRYVYIQHFQIAEIKRLRVECLGTVKSLDDWETVKRIFFK